MPREHAQITMTREELLAFLGQDRRLVLGTIAADGGPWGDAVAYALHDERVFFRVPLRTRSLANIRRDSRVCCVVESHPLGSSYYQIKGAIVHGKAEEARSGTLPGKVRSALDAAPDPVEPARKDGVVFSVGLEDVASFDFGKIKHRYE